MDETAFLFTLSLVTLWVPQVSTYREAWLQLNTKRVQRVVSERFLSLSLDPKEIASATPLGYTTLNMAKALHPMFVRLGGPSTDELHFDADSDPSANTTVTGEQWKSCHEFSQQAGVDLILSLNAMARLQKVWDSRNTLEIVSFSHENGMELAFQLGHSASRLKEVGGAELGRDVVRLRMILDAFPHYTRTPVLSPDLDLLPSEARFLREFLQEASPSLSAFPLQMRSVGIEEEDRLPIKGVLDMEALVWNAVPRNGKPIARKPLWISETEVSGGRIEDALSWVRRLGLAARHGYQVVLRQPQNFMVGKPSPDLWASLLFKALVGREVLEARLISGNRSALHVFAHCTEPSAITSIIDTMWNYEKGSVTLYGVNLSPDYTRLSIRMGMKEEAMHVYTLMEDPLTKEMSFNGEKLEIPPSGQLPSLSPRVRRASRVQTASVPPFSAFFLVFPEAKARSCSVNPLLQAAHEIASRLVLPHVEESLLLPHALGAPPDPRPQYFDGIDTDYDEGVKSYVKFGRPRKRLDSEEERQDYRVRYITFNDDPWLGQFADVVRPSLDEYKVDVTSEHSGEVTSDSTRREKREEAVDQLAEETVEDKESVTEERKILRESEKAVGPKGREGLNPRTEWTTPGKHEGEAKVALEELTAEGEKLIKTIDMSVNATQDFEKKSSEELENIQEADAIPKVQMIRSVPYGSGEAEVVREEAIKQMKEGLVEGLGRLQAKISENMDASKVKSILQNVMAEVKDKLEKVPVGLGQGVLKSLIEENIAKGSAFEVGAEGGGKEEPREEREEEEDNPPQPPKIVAPFDLKALSADNVRQTLEEFREKLRSSREKLRSMASLPSLDTSSVAAVGESLKAPLLEAKAEIERFIASRKEPREKRSLDTYNRFFEQQPLLTAIRRAAAIVDAQASNLGIPPELLRLLPTLPTLGPESGERRFKRSLESGLKTEDPHLTNNIRSSPSSYQRTVENVVIPKQEVSKTHSRIEEAGGSLPNEENVERRRSEVERDFAEQEMEARRSVGLAPLPPIQVKVGFGEEESLVPFRLGVQLQSSDDLLREKALAESGPRDLLSLAKKFTRLDLIQRRNKEMNKEDPLEDPKEKESSGERFSSEEEADWLAGTERLGGSSPSSSESEHSSEKKGHLINSVMNKLKSMMGFIVKLASRFQPSRPPVTY